MDAIFLLPVILILVIIWFESLRMREKVIKHCNQLCRETNLQLLDQTVSLASLALKRNNRGSLSLLRLYHFEVSENGVDRYSGYVSLLGDRVIESRLEGPEGRSTFYQGDPWTLH